MKIKISKLPVEGKTFSGEESAAILDLDDDPRVRLEAPIRYRIYAQIVSRRLIVRGTVRVELQLQCSRCAEFFSTTVEESAFLRAYDLPEGVETVDISDGLREALILRLPNFPVCDPDCQGLCPRCGHNLNDGPCGCGPVEERGPWGALDGLKL